MAEYIPIRRRRVAETVDAPQPTHVLRPVADLNGAKKPKGSLNVFVDENNRTINPATGTHYTSTDSSPSGAALVRSRTHYLHPLNEAGEAAPATPRASRAGVFAAETAGGRPTTAEGILKPVLDEGQVREADSRNTGRRGTTLVEGLGGAAANSDETAAELARQGFTGGGARSAREAARNNLRAMAAGTVAKKVSPEEAAAQRKTAAEESRSRRSAQAKENKVQQIYSQNLANLQENYSPAAFKGSYPTHPASGLGSNDLSAAAETAHAELTKFISNPEEALRAHAQAHHKVADQIEKVVPGHELAGQLRNNAASIEAAAGALSEKDRVGVSRGFTGPHSANDTLVEVAGMPMKQMRDARNQTEEKLVGGDRMRPVVSVANPAQYLATRTKDVYSRLLTAHKTIAKVLGNKPELMGAIPVSREDLEAGKQRASEIVSEGIPKSKPAIQDFDETTGERSKPGHVFGETRDASGSLRQIEATQENLDALVANGQKSSRAAKLIRTHLRPTNPTGGSRSLPTWETAPLKSTQVSSSGTRHPVEVDPATLPEEQRAYADSAGNVTDEKGRRYRKTDEGVTPHPTLYWVAKSQGTGKPQREIGYGSTAVSPGGVWKK